MSSISPSYELEEGVVVTDFKRLRAYHPSVVIAPASYDRVEFLDDCRLRGISHLSQFLPDFLSVPLDGFLTWAYDGLEAQWSSMRVLPCMGFSYAELAYGEPQEVKAHVSLARVKRVGYACLLQAQLQAHIS